jgi:hypothetical protein
MGPVPAALRRAVLVGILCLAALLRFAGIDHHVRRGSPAMDEQNNIVLPVLDMWSKPTANPGVRIGYSGFFNYVAFLPVGLGHRWAGEAGAYVAGRGLVAAFGVLSVFLVYRLARELAGDGPALLAAALQAVSRGEVGQSHYITPDVVVVTGTLAVLLLSVRSPLDVRRAAAAGSLCGLTIAVKYTGLLALPGLIAALVAEKLPRRQTLAALLAATVAFALAAPYAVLRASSPLVGTGLGSALRDYYGAGGYAATVAKSPPEVSYVAAEILGYISQNVGVVGLGLAALSLVLFRPLARLIPPLAVVALSVLVMLPARLVYPRHLLVPSAVLALLAACGLSGLVGRIASPRLRQAAAAFLCVAVLAVPTRSSVSLALRYLQPTSVDRAAGFIEASFPGHTLVATGLPRFALLRDRFEVRSWAPLHNCPPVVLRHYDLVVATREELAGLGFRLLREFDDGSDALGVAAPARPSLERVVPTAAAASHDPGHSLGPWLGASSWRSPEGGAWISGEWAVARRIERVEVVSDEAGGLRPQWLELEGRSDADSAWTKLDVWPLRPGRLSRQSADSPAGQIYVMAPTVPLVGLRLSSQGGSAWGLARIDVLAEAER